MVAAAAIVLARGRPPREPLIELVGRLEGLRDGRRHRARDARRRPRRSRTGEFVAIVGHERLGQVDDDEHPRLPRPPDARHVHARRASTSATRAGDSRAIVRNRLIGFIFQGFNLLPRTTALENVELPLQYRGVGARERRKRAQAVARRRSASAIACDHTPNQLSGGQQQRVAIARALVTDPPLLLADEPTGNLDTRTSLEVLALLQRLNRDRGITIVLVTHERDIAACASRVVTMRDGRIVSDVVQDAPLDAAAELARSAAGRRRRGRRTAVERRRARARLLRVGGPVPCERLRDDGAGRVPGLRRRRFAYRRGRLHLAAGGTRGGDRWSGALGAGASPARAGRGVASATR